MKQIMTDEEYQEKYGAAWQYQKKVDEAKIKYTENPREGWTDEQYKEAHGDKWEMWKANDEMNPEKKEYLESRAVAIVEHETEKKHKETRVEKFRKYAYLESVQKSFRNLLGGSDKVAQRYAESVIIAVAASEELQKCSPKSIMLAGLRAASLGLSVDPALSQAHLVPFGEDVTLIVDYHGLVQMTVDTNYYQIAPDVNEVYEGETITKDRDSGKITVGGKKVSDKIIGWRAYFKAKNGIERWLYMTNEECDKHAETYNPNGYRSSKTPWNNKGGANKDKMRRKTVLRIFVKKYGNFSPAQNQVFYSDEQVIEADMIDLPEPSVIPDPEPEVEKSPEVEKAERQARIQENLTVLGF